MNTTTNSIDNPFSKIRADDFTPKEINEYWINYNQDYRFLSPNEFLPKYILGGRGCGKTHLLRYFSYPLQTIRRGEISSIISDDMYLGIYIKFNGLNSRRFQGKSVDDEQWVSVFEFYFELYLCDVLLNIIKKIFLENISGEYSQTEFVKDIAAKFYENVFQKEDVQSIDNFLEALSNIRKKIDIEIVNVAFSRKLNSSSMKILFSPGELLFGIPSLLNKNISLLKNLKYIYILDEYEKLFNWQKVFINTLVWEKKSPCTFWIGARKYGFTTIDTKTKEKMKHGADYQKIDLDDIFQNNEKLYKKFANQLYEDRLKKFYTNDLTPEHIGKNFSDKLEMYTEDKIINELRNRKGNKEKEYQHIKELRKNIEKGIRDGIVEEIIDIDSSMESLVMDTDDNPLEQKYKICLLYSEWANWGSKNSKVHERTKKLKVNIDDIIQYVNQQYSLHNDGQKTEIQNIKEKYKFDLLAQLTNENNIKNTCYSGIDEFIDISWGNPRMFLMILKLIIDNAHLLGEKPMDEGSKISLEAQFKGVFETGKSFYQEIEILSDDGKNLYKSLNSLSDIFRIYRFSDKLTETSVCSFNFGMESISSKAKDFINLAYNHSLIIEVKKRKQKHSGREEKTYQLNKILAPIWNLPFSRRGVADLNEEMIEAIFDPEKHKTFESKYLEMKSRFMAPSFGKSKNNNTYIQPLFTD